MTKLTHFVIVMTLLASCTGRSENKLVYPETKKGNVVDTIFGTSVADPYRWLEDDMSEETAAWVKEQNSGVSSCIVQPGWSKSHPY